MKKILIITLSTLGVLVLTVLVVALFVEQDYAVKRSIVISKPRTEVFDYVKFLKNQDNFSTWARMDTNMKKTFTGEDATVGFVSAWESENENVGTGQQKIVALSEERIDYKLTFTKPFESESDVYLLLEAPDTANTNITWGFKSSMPYPTNLFLLFMNMEEMLGKDFEVGLNNLKEILEK